MKRKIRNQSPSEVKSTDPWEVFGKYDWYTISPSTGEAGETYTVTVICKENTELDDRIDTLNIKSDYWTGKRFVLTQKGTAYLNVEGVDMIDRRRKQRNIQRTQQSEMDC
ncbi:hypothetical protein NXW58_08100 [Bacteroides faecis]|nr:hypothetical protein NXW58_08100 [Bacteroides faecis]